MARETIIPTANERFFKENQIIVSKTDLRGRISYVNDVFLEVSGFTEQELLGKPHSIIRHPDMPRAIFKLFWETLESGNEIFAYVKNICKSGDYYWVLAHATPTVGDGAVVGYHSSRRVPERSAVKTIEALYQVLLNEEGKHSDPRRGLDASYEILTDLLARTSKPYDEYIWTIA